MSKKQPSDPSPNKWKAFAENAEERQTDIDDADLDQDAEAPELTEPDIEAESHDTLEYPSHETLEQELNALEMKLAEYKDQAVRAQAELENVRRRAERDVQNAHKYGTEKLLSDLLPVVDSIVRGLEGFAADDPHAEGLKLTLDILEKALEKHGVTVIAPESGEPFNPETQEAMSMQPAQGVGSNCVVQVLQKGYSLNGRVIRAAMVIVSS